MPTKQQPADHTGVLITALVARMLDKVELFNGRVRGQVIPAKPTPLTKQQAKRALDAIREEMAEFQEAVDAKDVLEQADALLDMVFFALGRLGEMGVPAWAVMEEINRANLSKQRGSLTKRPGWEGHDAIKLEGWQGPDHSWLASFSLVDLEKARKWDALSPLIKEAADIRFSKGQDYNSGPTLREYFPFGHLSYAQMLHVKNVRIQGLLCAMQQGRAPNFEGIRDTLKDLVNYTCFYAEAIDEGDLELASQPRAQEYRDKYVKMREYAGKGLGMKAPTEMEAS